MVRSMTQTCRSLLMTVVLSLTMVVPSPPLGAQSVEAEFGDFIYIQQGDSKFNADYSLIVTRGINSDRTSLAWRCGPHGLGVIYNFAGYVRGDAEGNAHVKYRVDDRNVSATQDWILETGNETASMLYGISEFTEMAEKGRVGVLHVTDPATGATRRDSFSLMGLTRGLEELPCTG